MTAPTIPLRESDLLAGVLDLARLLGWRTAVAGDGAGFPDLLAVRGERIVAAELKADRGRVTPAQTPWLAVLAAAGVAVYVWRPADYPDVIAETLR